MPPHGFTNPAPKTESAREAAKSFYCELCSKGYARMNLYEAHLSSYDHSHKQRLKDMRQLSKDPMAIEKARKAEAKANAGSGLISIKFGGDAGGGEGGTGGFKKGGFKKAGFKSAFVPANEGLSGLAKDDKEAKTETLALKQTTAAQNGDSLESDTEDEEDVYDPRYPTD